MKVGWEINRLSGVPAFQTFSSIGSPFWVPDGERIIGSWWAVEGDLSAVLNEQDLGPRHGAGTGFRETAIADGLVRLRVTPTRLIGTITAGATGAGHIRGSGAVGMNAANSRMGRDQGLEFYWPLVDIDLVGVLKTKKYLQWWDHEFYVQCEDPRAVLQLRNVSPKGPGKDWAVQRGLTGKSGSGTSMDGLAKCLVDAVTAARVRRPVPKSLRVAQMRRRAGCGPSRRTARGGTTTPPVGISSVGGTEPAGPPWYSPATTPWPSMTTTTSPTATQTHPQVHHVVRSLTPKATTVRPARHQRPVISS